MSHHANDQLVDLFLHQFTTLIIRLYTYEIISRSDKRSPILIKRGIDGTSMVDLNAYMIDMLKRAAWERLGSLIDLGAEARVSTAIESCERIIERAHIVAAHPVGNSLPEIQS